MKNARSIEGTVFVDASVLNKNNERLGNGIFDNGETTIAGVKVSLNEIGKDDSSYDGERVAMETTTDENGVTHDLFLEMDEKFNVKVYYEIE